MRAQDSEPLRHLSIVALSGTVDRLYMMAVMVAGAAADGMRVDVLLDSWSIVALQRYRGGGAVPVSSDYGSMGQVWFDQAQDTIRGVLELSRVPSWVELVEWARGTGLVRVRASHDMLTLLGLDLQALEPIVDGTTDIERFVEEATDGQLLSV